MGFHGFPWVFGGCNHFQLGGPSWGVGGFQEVSGGYNLQNRAWTFADVATYTCSFWGSGGLVVIRAASYGRCYEFSRLTMRWHARCLTRFGVLPHPCLSCAQCLSSVGAPMLLCAGHAGSTAFGKLRLAPDALLSFEKSGTST